MKLLALNDIGLHKSERRGIPDTNIIIGSPLRFRYAISKSWAEHLQDYLQTIERNIEKALLENPENTNIRIERLNHYAWRVVEFYWEFQSNNPYDLVVKLSSELKSISHFISSKDYELDQPEKFTEKLSTRIRIRLLNGINLKIYAKTDNRVRFEIEYSRREISNTLLKGGNNASMTDLVSGFERLALDAESRMNDIFSALAQSMNPVEAGNSPTELLHEIVSACDNPEISELIISNLIHTKRLALSDNDDFRAEIEKLKRRNVLRSSNGKDATYILTDNYRLALEKIIAYENPETNTETIKEQKQRTQAYRRKKLKKHRSKKT